MLLAASIIAAVLTIALAGVIFMADAMSDAPSMQGISVVPTLLIGGGISVGLFLLWYFGGSIPWVR